VLSAGTRETKYEASTSTLSKPPMLSGPTESSESHEEVVEDEGFKSTLFSVLPSVISVKKLIYLLKK